MQSTGVYWFAVYDVLEKHGLKVFLVNASHTKNLPGRKSDVQESQLRDRRIKASEEEVARSLEGNWQEDQLFELQQAVDEYDFRQKQISECDRGLQAYLAVLPSRPVPAADTGNVMPPPIAPGKRKKRAKKTGGGNAPPSFDLAAELKRVTGVDAIRIEGVNLMTIQTVVAELGTELGKWWPTEQHFASWLGLSPKRDVSGGKVIRHTHEKNRNRVAGILRLAAISLLRSDSYLGARYRNLRTRLGAPKAIQAMARYLACIIYRLFTKGHACVDRGAEQFEQHRQTRDLARLQAQAHSRGCRLVPTTDQVA
jgi:hypothetical protein